MSKSQSLLTDFVLEASADNLNEMDQSTLIKLFVTLIKNNEEKIDLLIDGLIKTRVYICLGLYLQGLVFMLNAKLPVG